MTQFPSLDPTEYRSSLWNPKGGEGESVGQDRLTETFYDIDTWKETGIWKENDTWKEDDSWQENEAWREYNTWKENDDQKDASMVSPIVPTTFVYGADLYSHGKNSWHAEHRETTDAIMVTVMTPPGNLRTALSWLYTTRQFITERAKIPKSHILASQSTEGLLRYSRN